MSSIVPRYVAKAHMICRPTYARSAPTFSARPSFVTSPVPKSRCYQPWTSRIISATRQACTSATAIEIEVQTIVEADSKTITDESLKAVLKTIESDSRLIVQNVLGKQAQVTGTPIDKPQELSLVLCDNEYMRRLNKAWRNKDCTTDVLSFEMTPDEFDMDVPVRVLGDVVISVDVANSQAQERAAKCADGATYTLQDEVRVLLIHGVLHLIGYDHELGAEAAAAMAQEEQRIMFDLSWKGQGLIEAADDDGYESMASNSVDWDDGGSMSTFTNDFTSDELLAPVNIVCLDMDGTLLDNDSQISPATAACLKRCLALDDVTILISTGKARPAALAACKAAGLTGPGGLVSEDGPGIFLQGLAVYGPDGDLLPGVSLPESVVRLGFEFAEANNVSCAAFHGDTLSTLTMTPDLMELHTRYYEPLAEVKGSLDELLKGVPVKKLLMMSTPDVIDDLVVDYFHGVLPGTGAAWTQAVDTMLEVVPDGVNKWVGLQQYLAITGQSSANVMACGDGLNDYELLANVGLGVAMANAVDEVIEIADFVTDSNDEDGVVAAIERFVM